MKKLINACKKGSAAAVEEQVKTADLDLNTPFKDAEGNETYPITWCCKNDVLSLVELMVKKGADPNRTFIDNEGKTQSVINWACKQDNGALVEILINNGARASVETFMIAKELRALKTLTSLSPQIEPAISELYHSKTYQAYEKKMVDYSDGNVYIFAFNTGQANLILVRRGDKGVLVDAGDASSDLIRTFRESNKKFARGVEECTNIIKHYEDLKEHRGRVKLPFKTTSRAEPRDTYKRIEDLCRECFDKSENILETFESIEGMSFEEEDKIKEIVELVKTKFAAGEVEKQKHCLRLAFSGDFKIEAVFITHPHKDHYSILGEIFNNYKASFENTEYFLGGIPEDWDGDISKRLLKLLGIRDSKDPSKWRENGFVGREFESEDHTYLDGIRFKLWGRTTPQNPSDKNELSLLITMYYKGMNILFTGDAQGNVLERLSVDKPKVDDSLKDKEAFDKILDELVAIIKEARHTLPKPNIKVVAEEKLEEFLKGIKKKADKEKYRGYIDELLSLEKSFLVFEPHHGSMTEASHEIYNYMFAQDLKQIFVICSFPVFKDFLPKEESVMNRENPHITTKYHPIVYAANGKIPTMSMTTDPVYTTGAAGDNLYLMKIEEGKVNFLDLYNEEPTWETFEQETK